eukprot:5610799-Heterocapsa_arctica.AAC.1
MSCRNSVFVKTVMLSMFGLARDRCQEKQMVGRVPGNGLNTTNTTSEQNRQDGRTLCSLADPL